MASPEEFDPTETIDTDVEQEKPPIDVSNMSTFEAWAAEQREMPFKHFNKITNNFGEIGTRFMTSMKSTEMSGTEKVGAGVAAAVDSVGAVFEGASRIGAVGQLASLGGERSSDVYQAGMGGFIDSFTEKVAKEKEDGTYSFDAAGIAEVANLKGVVTTGVEGVFSGVDAGMQKANEFAEEDLALDPSSQSANRMTGAYDVYDSKVADKLKEAAQRKATAAVLSKIL
jgi:hypothetical protein